MRLRIRASVTSVVTLAVAGVLGFGLWIWPGAQFAFISIEKGGHGPAVVFQATGANLRSEIDKIYLNLKYNEELRTSTHRYTDISPLCERYIRVGVSFDDAEETLRYAGFNVVWSRQRAGGRLDDPLNEYSTIATLHRLSFFPPGYLDAFVILHPSDIANFSKVGRVRAYIRKVTWWRWLTEGL